MVIAHPIITEKHQGTLTYDSKLGKGTTFYCFAFDDLTRISAHFPMI